MRQRILLIWAVITLLMTACLPTSRPTNPEQQTTVEQLEASYTFDSAASIADEWQTYTRADLFVGVVDARLRMLTTVPGRYVWSLTREPHENAILAVEAALNSSNDKAVYGLICRGNRDDGRGYHFLVSADGAYSIRRGVRNGTEPLVKWQSHRAIYTDGRTNTLRAICRGEYLALYVNGTYIDSTIDDAYASGFAGVVVDLPTSAAGAATTDILFDNFRRWSVE